jgi:hypothetical protein
VEVGGGRGVAGQGVVQFGKGFQAGVRAVGFAEGDVTWTEVAFNNAFAPGEKDFDFAVNQISITTERARLVDFSSPYFDEVMGLVSRFMAMRDMFGMLGDLMGTGSGGGAGGLLGKLPGIKQAKQLAAVRKLGEPRRSLGVREHMRQDALDHAAVDGSARRTPVNPNAGNSSICTLRLGRALSARAASAP